MLYLLLYILVAYTIYRANKDVRECPLYVRLCVSLGWPMILFLAAYGALFSKGDSDAQQ